MKRETLLIVGIVLSLMLGFGSGYWYRHNNPSIQGEMEDYATTNVLHEVMYARYLAKGELSGLRDAIDLNLNGHLARVVRYKGTLDDQVFLNARLYALSSAARLWDEQPPFKSLAASSSNLPWWPEWQEMTAKNIELLTWAKQECAANPEACCTSSNLSVKRDGIPAVPYLQR